MPRFLLDHLGKLATLAFVVLVLPHAGADQVGNALCLAPAGCPNLVVDVARMDPDIQVQTFPPTDCAVVEGSVHAGTRTLLRFTFATPNVGPGDLVVGDPELRADLFEFSLCHGHYHFKEYADYRLWTPEAFAQWDALRKVMPNKQAAQVLEENPDLRDGFVTGEKRGFCVIDVRMYTSQALPGKYSDCSRLQGITAGWGDEYGKHLSGQWVDITGLASGTYVLEAEVNAERLLTEANYRDNRAWTSVDVPAPP